MTDSLRTLLDNGDYDLLIDDRKTFNKAIALLDDEARDTFATLLAMAVREALAEQAWEQVPLPASPADKGGKKKTTNAAGGKKKKADSKAPAKQCKGKNKNKERCGNKTTNSSGLCYKHE